MSLLIHPSTTQVLFISSLEGGRECEYLVLRIMFKVIGNPLRIGKGIIQT
jgi:hypothetical protein